MLHFSWELLFSFKGFGLYRLSQHFIVLEKVVLSSIQPLQFLRSGATHNVVRKGVPGYFDPASQVALWPGGDVPSGNIPHVFATHIFLAGQVVSLESVD